MNDVKLLGRIAQISKLNKKNEKNEKKWINFTLAVNRYVKGEQQTDFIQITAFGKTAELIAKYCNKGSQLIVEARLKVDKYKDKQGKTKQQLSVIAENIYFCGSNNTKKEEKDDELDEQLKEFFEEAPAQKEDDLPY